jgi:hypothetical protein
MQYSGVGRYTTASNGTNSVTFPNVFILQVAAGPCRQISCPQTACCLLQCGTSSYRDHNVLWARLF